MGHTIDYKLYRKGYTYMIYGMCMLYVNTAISIFLALRRQKDKSKHIGEFMVDEGILYISGSCECRF